MNWIWDKTKVISEQTKAFSEDVGRKLSSFRSGEALIEVEEDNSEIESYLDVICTFQVDISKVPSDFHTNHSKLLDSLCEPVEAQFRFHFHGDAKTNRISHPEWFFRFVLQAVETHVKFLQDVVLPTLQYDAAVVGAENSISQRLAERMLRLADDKCVLVIEEIFATTKDFEKLFHHFLSELMNFDRSIRAIWSKACSPSLEWWSDNLFIHKRFVQEWLSIHQKIAQRYIQASSKGEIADRMSDLWYIELGAWDSLIADSSVVGSLVISSEIAFVHNLNIRKQFLQIVIEPCLSTMVSNFVKLFLQNPTPEFKLVNICFNMKKSLSRLKDIPGILETWYVIEHGLEDTSKCRSAFVQSQPDLKEVKELVFSPLLSSMSASLDLMTGNMFDRYKEDIRLLLTSVYMDEELWATRSYPYCASSSALICFKELVSLMSTAEKELNPALHNTLLNDILSLLDSSIAQQMIKKIDRMTLGGSVQVLLDLVAFLEAWDGTLANPKIRFPLISELILILDADNDTITSFVNGEHLFPTKHLPEKTVLSLAKMRQKFFFESIAKKQSQDDLIAMIWERMNNPEESLKVLADSGVPFPAVVSWLLNVEGTMTAENIIDIPMPNTYLVEEILLSWPREITIGNCSSTYII